MENKKISTGLGTIIIVIVAITVGVFIWQYQKNNKMDEAKIAVVELDKINKATQMIDLAKFTTTLEKTDEYELRQNPNSKEIYYTNKIYGFNLVLPSDWENDLDYRFIGSNEEKEFQIGIISFKAFSRDKSSNLTFDKYINLAGNTINYSIRYYIPSKGLHQYENQDTPYRIYQAEKIILKSFYPSS